MPLTHSLPITMQPLGFRLEAPMGTGISLIRRLPAFRASLAVLLCMAVSSQETVHARDYQVRRRSGEHIIEAFINRNPPVMGNNEIRIAVRNSRGDHVRGALVEINYFMPPMPGMPPMNYTVTARPYRDGYRATMDLIMMGPWNIAVTVRTGQDIRRILFPIEVR